METEAKLITPTHKKKPEIK